MWIENRIPLVDFYNACKQNLKKADYKLLLCLISRRADSPELFEEIRKYWSSFHDVTGNSILFMFAGDNIYKLGSGSHILVDNVPSGDTKGFRAGAEIIYSNSALISGDYITRLGGIDSTLLKSIHRGCPRIQENQDFEESHSLEISRLSRLVGIQESDIPSLNVTYLPYQLSVNISLGKAIDFYAFIKFLSAEFYKSELSHGCAEDLIQQRQYQQHVSQARANLRAKIEKLEKETDNGFGGDFRRWANMLIQKKEFKTNKIIEIALDVISNYIIYSKESVLKQLFLLRKELPDTGKYQRMLRFSQKYLSKYYDRRFSPDKLYELKMKLRELEELPISNIFLNRFNEYIQRLIDWHSLTNAGETKLQAIKMALISGNVQGFIDILKSLFAALSYNIKLNEGYFHAHIHTILDLCGIRVISERETNVGRIDAVAEVGQYIYIMEFKLDDANAAIDQIKSRRYYETYVGSGKEVVLLGIAFSIEQKNISNYIVDATPLP